MNLNPVTDWANLARVNNVLPTHGGGLEGASAVYMAHLRAVMILAAPSMSGIKPLLEWLDGAMREAGGKIPWRDSFAM